MPTPIVVNPDNPPIWDIPLDPELVPAGWVQVEVTDDDGNDYWTLVPDDPARGTIKINPTTDDRLVDRVMFSTTSTVLIVGLYALLKKFIEGFRKIKPTA
jgi:hypothetical protein